MLSTPNQNKPSIVDSALNSDSLNSSGSEQLALIFKASADPLRLEVLRALSKDSFSVQELCAAFDVKQSGMSHHLKVLAKAGLVLSRREGNFIFYQRRWQAGRDVTSTLTDAIYQSVDHIELDEQVLNRIQAVQQQRGQLSQAFFAANANEFRSQQELIATADVYNDHVAQWLEQLNLPRRDTALEIGPGEGLFLSTLASSFKQVVALDNSSVMLEKAQENGAKNGLNNVLYIEGDTQQAIQKGLRADCVVINMVLHHTPSPAAIFQDVAELLLPGASLIVTELCHHDQPWVREACGDLWLGFEPADLSHWAREARLEPGQEQYLALRNGFQFQIRQFFKP
jgi:ArsR family transcriptional regulator